MSEKMVNVQQDDMIKSVALLKCQEHYVEIYFFNSLKQTTQVRSLPVTVDTSGNHI